MAHAADATKFPLYLHRASGHWCKTVKGKRHYFGKDKSKALEDWHRRKDDLLAGVQAKPDDVNVTVQYCCNFLLTRKKMLVESGDLSNRQYLDLKVMCKFVIEHFGRNRSVASISPDDFGVLRAKMSKRWAPSGLVARVNNIRQIFRFAYRNGVIEREVRFGDQFAPPSKRIRRKARSARGEKMYETDEIRLMLESGTAHQKAFILLAVNCGLGNQDVALLEHRHLDMTTGWLTYARGKTGVRRRSKVWAETIAAIRLAIAEQPKTKRYAEYLFVTRFRKLWTNPDTTACSLSQSFTKLARAVGVHKPGNGFYTLRHVTETIGGECRDQAAVDLVLGHDDGSMANEYRERLSDERLEAVADTLHAWLFQSGGKAR